LSLTLASAAAVSSLSMPDRYLFIRKETTMSTAKLAIPTLLAVFALVFAFKTVGIGSANGEQVSNAASTGPTPYSADHARITAGDGPAQEPVPTF
jgi:hypothetical protein